MQDKSPERRKNKENIGDKPHPAGPAPNDDLNQNHNTKKVALGPNTKR